MLVTFSTDANADITLFGDIAINMLHMMGHSGTVPSAILAEDVPAALNRLSAAIEATKTPAPAKQMDRQSTSMATRARPLLELLSSAAKAKTNVMWS